MAPTNTQVVRRSIMLAEEWQQPVRTRTSCIRKRCATTRRSLARKPSRRPAGLGLLFAALKQPLTRRLRPAAAAEAGHGTVGQDDGRGLVHVRPARDRRGWPAGARADSSRRRPRATARPPSFSASRRWRSRSRRRPSRRARARRCADAGDGVGRCARRTSSAGGYGHRHPGSRNAFRLTVTAGGGIQRALPCWACLARRSLARTPPSSARFLTYGESSSRAH